MYPYDLAQSYYLWLMPQREIYDEFRTIILHLSQSCKTPAFEPHITLVSGLSGDEDTLIKKIDTFAQNKHFLTVTLEGIDYTQGIFTALYIKSQYTPEINQLNLQARCDLDPFGQEPYQPHLSLLYGHISPEEKERIITRLNLSPKTITLDKLKLVKGHSKVTLWRTIKEWPLR